MSGPGLSNTHCERTRAGGTHGRTHDELRDPTACPPAGQRPATDMVTKGGGAQDAIPGESIRDWTTIGVRVGNRRESFDPKSRR